MVNAADADEDEAFSADDVSALNLYIGELKKEIFKIHSTVSVQGITDGNLGNYLRQEMVTLEGLTAEVGVIDSEGCPTSIARD